MGSGEQLGDEVNNLEFAFRWCAGGCERLEAIGNISIVYVSHCVMLV